jgi:ribonuclease P protein component
MIPKSNRITRKRIYMLKKHSKTYRGNYLTLLVEKKTLSESSGFAVIVSGKISKLAVSRNRLKRKLRFIIISTIPSLVSGFNCLVIAHPNALLMKNDSLSRDFNYLCGCAGLKS